VLPRIARGGLPLLVHAELTGPVSAPDVSAPRDCRSYARHPASRPREWEHDAIRLLIALCRETGCRVHVVHLASADALPMLAEARAEGLPLAVRAWPRYLTLPGAGIPH